MPIGGSCVRAVFCQDLWLPARLCGPPAALHPVASSAQISKNLHPGWGLSPLLSVPWHTKPLTQNFYKVIPVVLDGLCNPNSRSNEDCCGQTTQTNCKAQRNQMKVAMWVERLGQHAKDVGLHPSLHQAFSLMRTWCEKDKLLLLQVSKTLFERLACKTNSQCRFRRHSSGIEGYVFMPSALSVKLALTNLSRIGQHSRELFWIGPFYAGIRRVWAALAELCWFSSLKTNCRQMFNTNSTLNTKGVHKYGALRKGPPFHGSRRSREIKLQNASCQMGGREVTGRWNCFFLRENEWSRSYKATNQHPSLPWNFITHGFLDPSSFPENNSTWRPNKDLLGLPCLQKCVLRLWGEIWFEFLHIWRENLVWNLGARHFHLPRKR